MNAMEQYMMQRELDEARAQLAQIRAVLNGYPDSDLIDLAKLVRASGGDFGGAGGERGGYSGAVCSGGEGVG
jgi:hypothetical protein